MDDGMHNGGACATAWSLLAVAGLAPMAVAAPGDFDPAFGNGGKVLTPIGDSHDYAYGVALQDDGRIVAAGYAWFSRVSDFAALRYQTDGTLDPTFGDDGKVTVDLGGHDLGFDVVLHDGGEVLVAGSSTAAGTEDFALVRLLGDGTLDSAFGNGGVVLTDVAGGSDVARGVALQDDGKIVAVGTAGNHPNQEIVLARYMTDGALDPTFGIGGLVVTSVVEGQNGVYDVAVQGDGRVVAAGGTESMGLSAVAVLRFLPDGSPDPSFGSGGAVTTDLGAGTHLAQGLTLYEDGRILVAGFRFGAVRQDFLVARYEADGALDTSFNGTGSVVTDLSGGHDNANAVVVRDDGRIIVAGYANNRFGIIRYLPDGTPDTSFGPGGTGVVLAEVGNGFDAARDLVLQPDGKIVAAGNAQGSAEDFGLARFESEPPAPEILVRGNGVEIANGDATPSADDLTDFGSVAPGLTIGRTFTIRNEGFSVLTIGTVTVDGPDAASFSVVVQPDGGLGGSETTTFETVFSPAASGAYTAVVTIPNGDSDKNPFTFTIAGTGLSFTNDADGDGLNDASESQLAALGFDWETDQSPLVETLFGNLGGALPNLNEAGFFTEDQVRALHTGAHLVPVDPESGNAHLTLWLEEAPSTDDLDFSPLPFTAPDIVINEFGELEFAFPAADRAAFFRIGTR